jgi:hypothetical protein
MHPGRPFLARHLNIAAGVRSLLGESRRREDGAESDDAEKLLRRMFQDGSPESRRPWPKPAHDHAATRRCIILPPPSMNRLTRLRNRRSRQPRLPRRHRLPLRYCLSKRSARGELRGTQNHFPAPAGLFRANAARPFRVGGVLRIGALSSSISRGAGLARTIRLWLSGPMAVGVISARANIRHHTALVTDNSPPMMAAPPPSGILCGVSNSGVCTPGTVSPVCGVRSRCHKQRGSTQHQQTLHDRLLSMRGPRRLPASYDDVRPHHRAPARTGRTFFRSCSAHNLPNRPRAPAQGKPLREEGIRR